MPYKEEKSVFLDPPDSNISLWRYMDFTKFVSLLQTSCLFFPSAKTLREIDPWEGIWPEESLKSVEDNYNYQRIKYKFESNSTDIKQVLITGIETRIDTFFVSCWHYNNIESAAMWRLYLKSNEGVCIKSKLKNFKLSFNKFLPDVNCGRVYYLDHLEDDLYKNPNLSKYAILTLPFVHKRKIYISENEYRAVTNIDKKEEDRIIKTDKGIFVPIILNSLIEEVIVAPSSPTWFFELVKSILLTYKIDKNVRRSIVEDSPEFSSNCYKTYSQKHS